MTSLLTTQRERLTEREVERAHHYAQGLYALRSGLFTVSNNGRSEDEFDINCIRAALERMEAREDER